MDVTREMELSPDLTPDVFAPNKVVDKGLSYKIAYWTFCLKLIFEFLRLFAVDKPNLAEIVIITSFYVISVLLMESENLCTIRLTQNSVMSSNLGFLIMNHLKR